MALKYGFGLYDDDPTARKIWERKYQALSDDDKAFGSDLLVAILIATDIEVVMEKTIPHITRRLEIKYPDWPSWVKEKTGMEVSDYLKRFIGFRVNIETRSTTDFIKKVTFGLLSLGTKGLKEIHESSKDLVLDEASLEELPLFINREWTTKEAQEKYQRFLEKGKDECRS